MQMRRMWISVVLLVVSGLVTAADADTATILADNQWLSVLPPLFAIALALIIRQVLVAMFAGVWLGAWILNDFSVIRSGHFTAADL